MAEQLDAARERLVEELLSAETGESPIEAMEQFIPLAILPIVKTGIKIAGRKRVINFVAGLLAKLIKPVVGAQLAKPLATQIADQGFALLNLEAEAGSGRLGAEAIVAASEDAIREVFSCRTSCSRTSSFLRRRCKRRSPMPLPLLPGDRPEGGRGRTNLRSVPGTWIMMPRATGPDLPVPKIEQTDHGPCRSSRSSRRGVLRRRDARGPTCRRGNFGLAGGCRSRGLRAASRRRCRPCRLLRDRWPVRQPLRGVARIRRTRGARACSSPNSRWNRSHCGVVRPDQEARSDDSSTAADCVASHRSRSVWISADPSRR